MSQVTQTLNTSARRRPETIRHSMARQKKKLATMKRRLTKRPTPHPLARKFGQVPQRPTTQKGTWCMIMFLAPLAGIWSCIIS